MRAAVNPQFELVVATYDSSRLCCIFARFAWWLQDRRIGRWPITNFYPFRHPKCQRPDSVYAIRRTVKHLGGPPRLIGGAIRHPSPLSGDPHQVESRTEIERSSTHSHLGTLLSDIRMKLQLGAFRNRTGFQESPQRHQEFSCQCNDSDLS